jgi:hypothetical protein
MHLSTGATGAALLALPAATAVAALGGAGLILLAGRADGRAPESAIARAA